MQSFFCTLATVLLLLASLAGSEQPPVHSDFQDNILRAFAGDDQADVRVIFGYDSMGDSTDPADPVRAQCFIDYLVGNKFVECRRDPALFTALGVRPEAPNLHIFTGPGRAQQTIRVSLIWSALTPKTAKNVGKLYAEQVRCSGDALKFMQKAASESEVMVYLGHSRGGGGPDTFPPEVISGGKGTVPSVDYSYYREHRPGLATLRPYFALAREKPHIIALTSCLTDNHFRTWLSENLSGKLTPTSLVLSTRLTQQLHGNDDPKDSDEGIMVLTTLIEALQFQPTQSAFEKRLKACELDAYHVPGKPAWKVITLPGKTRQP